MVGAVPHASCFGSAQALIEWPGAAAPGNRHGLLEERRAWLSGTVAERLAGLASDGFTRFNFWLSGDRAEQRERLVNDMLPAVRELAR
jgi:hypothetical protein